MASALEQLATASVDPANFPISDQLLQGIREGLKLGIDGPDVDYILTHLALAVMQLEAKALDPTRVADQLSRIVGLMERITSERRSS